MRLIFLILFCPFVLVAQPPVDRYQAPLFTGVTETNNVLFSSSVPVPEEGGGFYEFITGLPLNVDEYDTYNVDLEMDIFQPSGDTLSNRPLIIICFGGGFLTGSKEHWSIRLLCQELAKRGFVTAAIDYRLGMNIFDEDLSMRAVYRGVQDARSAVRFFRADAAGDDVYKIDPDQIYVGGHSAGAFISLHQAYIDKEIERPLSTYEWPQDGNIAPDQECMDCVGNNTEYSGDANAIFSLAGGIGFTSFIENASDPSCVMFHSTDDGTVEYNSGEPFGDILWLVVGSDLPVAYGSLPQSLRMDTVGVPYEFFSYTDRGHGVHEDDPELYDDIVPGIGDWFYNQELKPIYPAIDGDDIVCTSALEQFYFLGDLLQGQEGVYFDWSVDGGVFTEVDTEDASVVVEWDANAASHSLEVIPYSALDAAGDTLVLEITIDTSGTNTFLEMNDVWENSNNWSLNHIPSACEDVIILDTENPQLIFVNQSTEINSLYLGDGNTMTVLPNTVLVIHEKTGMPSITTLQNEGVINVQGTVEVKE